MFTFCQKRLCQKCLSYCYTEITIFVSTNDRVDEEPSGWRGEINQHVENIGISGVYLGTGLLVVLAVHDPAMNFS